MKRFSVALLASLFVLTFFSCKKDNGSEAPDPGTDPNPTGVATAVGTPDGTPVVKKTIGAGGGSLVSGDNRLKIVVPAGAFAADQEVSIQAISNQNPLGIGKAYRITPHNVTFAKAVNIQFIYDDEDVQRTVPEALGIAYQDENRIWKARGGSILDKNQKTVTVTTTHFSDWSFFESFYLLLKQSVLPVDATTELEVFTAEDLIVPLEQEKDIAIGQVQSVAAKYIKEWKLDGAGNLTSNGSFATYKAPATLPAKNPVTVSVRLDFKKRGILIMLKTITIINDDGFIEVRTAGGGWKRLAASGATKFTENTFSVADADGDSEGAYVFVRWVGGVGTHAYKNPYVNEGTHAHYQVTGVTTYICSYVSGDRLLASGGGVTITDMGQKGGFIKGTFVIDPAGYGDNLMQTTTVEGRFEVRRYW